MDDQANAFMGLDMGLDMVQLCRVQGDRWDGRLQALELRGVLCPAVVEGWRTVGL